LGVSQPSIFLLCSHICLCRAIWRLMARVLGRPHLQRAILDNRAGVCLGGQVPAATAALRAHQRAALRIQDPRLHDDQSPALPPDLIFGRCRPLVEFHSGAPRRDSTCPRHAQNRLERHKSLRHTANRAPFPNHSYTIISASDNSQQNPQPVELNSSAFRNPQPVDPLERSVCRLIQALRGVSWSCPQRPAYDPADRQSGFGTHQDNCNNCAFR
jgi:hypothetical protein